MTFEYTGRHVEVTPAIRRHVEEQFKKLDHLFDGSGSHAHIILAVEKNRHTGEVIIHWRAHALTAKDTNGDMYMALSRAISKIEKQASKLKKNIIDRKYSSLKTSIAASSPDEQLKASPLPVRLINARRYNVNPVFAEESALELSD